MGLKGLAVIGKLAEEFFVTSPRANILIIKSTRSLVVTFKPLR